MQLQQHKSELIALDVDVVVVTFERDAVAVNYARQQKLPWPILVDESRTLYSAFGMDRGSWRAIYGLSSWWGYLKLLLRGRRLHRPTGDVHQLGGDILVDPQGVIRVHHVGRTPVDRPSVESLLDVVRNAPGEAARE